MGGHGGLNILPQKRWNVYGRRNRLKVHEDEAKHAEEETERHEKEEKAEREFRTDQLRKRNRSNVPNHIEHINFFEEEEKNQEHQDVKREREMEDRKRGRKSDRTSDAKFDERFAFAHRLNDSKPWYARPVARFAEKDSKGEENNVEKDAKSLPAAEAESSDKKKTHTEKKRSKKEKKRKKARELLKELKKSNFKKAEIDTALLRIERLRREKKEKVRVRELSNKS